MPARNVLTIAKENRDDTHPKIKIVTDRSLRLKPDLDFVITLDGVNFWLSIYDTTEDTNVTKPLRIVFLRLFNWTKHFQIFPTNLHINIRSLLENSDGRSLYETLCDSLLEHIIKKITVTVTVARFLITIEIAIKGTSFIDSIQIRPKDYYYLFQ